MRSIKKLFVLFFALNIVFSLSFSPVFAWSFPSGATLAESAVNKMIGMFGVDRNELKNTVQTMNVARLKKTPPQVKLNFTPGSPVAGMQITASATATYFINDPSVLYYTWYLKHNTGKATSKDSAGRKTKDGNTDWNEDGIINIEDYKIEAMHLIANGGFDWQKASDEGQYSSASSDDDGYQSIFGGEDQRGKNNHCYLHDFNSGEEYEISCDKHLFPNAIDETTGDNSFSSKEEKFWHTNPNSKDTANSGSLDEATVSGLGKNTLTWNYMTGDKIGVVVEGASVESTNYKDASYKIMWAMPKNICGVSPKDPNTSLGSSSTTVDSDPTYEYAGTVLTTDVATGLPYETPTQDKVIIKTVTTTTTGISGVEVVTTETIVVTEKRYKQVVTNPFDTTASIVYSTTSTDTELSSSTTSTSIETINTSKTKVSDLNNCLEDNFVEPSEGASDKKIDVSLSYQPESPMNSESADTADKLIIQSSIMGAENKSFLNYAWQVYLSSDIGAEDKDWKMLTLADLDDQTGLKKLSGIGLDSLKMNLNFKDSLPTLKDNQKTFYAKVVLRAVEVTAEKKKEGVGTIIIPIQLSSNTLKVFSASVTDSLALDLDINTKRCDSGVAMAICPVVKNEIIGVKLDLASPTNYDFLWSFDNMPVTEAQKNIAYIPILGERDSRHILSLTALNKTTGEKILLNRTFEVIDPTISIVSVDTDTCAPTLLGYYIDPINKNINSETNGGDESQWPDLSVDKFEALSGEIIKLKPSSNTIISGDKAAWFFDDVQITADNMSSLGVTAIEDDGTLVFKANKAVGERYEITLGALYTQPNLVKKALYETWEVPQTNFYEKVISQTIKIEVTDTFNSSGIAMQNKNPQQKILASLFSAMPSYIIFLFRIVLTIILILFLIHLLFSFFPEQKQV